MCVREVGFFRKPFSDHHSSFLADCTFAVGDVTAYLKKYSLQSGRRDFFVFLRHETLSISDIIQTL